VRRLALPHDDPAAGRHYRDRHPPAGVGASKGRFLRDGDTVEIEVDGLGTLSNRVRRE
jgi:hypothetical protein